MTVLSKSPHLKKGALIGMYVFNPLANVDDFPVQSRYHDIWAGARAVGCEGKRGEVMSLKGPPKEIITLSIELDAADQLDQTNPLTVAMGVSPVLSALEMYVSPRTLLS